MSGSSDVVTGADDVPPIGRRFRVAFPLIGAVVGALAGVAVSFFQPKVYESVATIRFHHDGIVFGSEVLGEEPAGGLPSPQIPWRLAVASSATAGLACDQLGLAETWGVSREEAIERIVASCASEPVAASDLVRLRVRDRDAELARDLAEAIAKAFVQRLREEQEFCVARLLEGFEAEKKYLSAALERKRAAVLAETAAGEDDESEEKKQRAQAERLDLLRERERLHAVRKRMEELRGEARLQFASSLTVEGNGVTRFYDELLTERKRLEDLKASGLGSVHPSVLRGQDRLEELDNLLRGAIVALRGLMDAEIDALEKRLRELEELRSAPNSTEAGESLPEYSRARQEYEDARDRLRRAEDGHSSVRAKLHVPTKPATIHDAPRLPSKPVPDARRRCVLLGSVAGLVVGLLAALLPSRRGGAADARDAGWREMAVPPEEAPKPRWEQ